MVAGPCALHVGELLLDFLKVQLVRAEPEHVALSGDGDELALPHLLEMAARGQVAKSPCLPIVFA
jgi:hypothetical protein